MTTAKSVDGSPTKPKLRRLPLPVLLGAMALVGLFALLALNTASAAQELKQSTLTDNIATTSDQEQQLLRDLAAKQAPAALASAALAQGLVPNPNPAFLRLNADGSVTVLGSPMPATSVPPPVTPTPTPIKSATPSKSASARKSATAAATKPGAKPTAQVTVTVTAPAPTATVTAPKVITATTRATKTSAAKTSAAARPSSTATGGQ